MGSFYTNVALRGPDQRQILQALIQADRVAYVSPTVDGFTVIYDKETEDQEEGVLKALASQLSKRFACPALAALVHDSDVFMYWLFEAGDLVDEFDSAPDYFGSSEESSLSCGGDAERLCAAFGVEEAVPEMAALFESVEAANFDEDWSVDDWFGADFLFAEDIHDELARILRMPTFVLSGYTYIEAGELPEGLDSADLLKCL
jgi:hypothetical protein